MDAYDYSYVIYFEFDYFLDIYKTKDVVHLTIFILNLLFQYFIVCLYCFIYEHII